MDIFTGIASILGGGITGLIGSVTQRVFEYKSKKLDIELEKNRFEHEVALKSIQYKAAVDVEDSKAFNTALSSEPKMYHDQGLSNKQNWLMVILDFIRGSIRPGLTIYLCGITTAIYSQAKAIMGTSLLPFQAYELVNQIINTILYLTTTCILFWFGTRNKKLK